MGSFFGLIFFEIGFGVARRTSFTSGSGALVITTTSRCFLWTIFTFGAVRLSSRFRAASSSLSSISFLGPAAFSRTGFQFHLLLTAFVWLTAFLSATDWIGAGAALRDRDWAGPRLWILILIGLPLRVCPPFPSETLCVSPFDLFGISLDSLCSILSDPLGLSLDLSKSI